MNLGAIAAAGFVLVTTSINLSSCPVLKIAIFKAADAKHRFALMVVNESLSLQPQPVAPDVSYKES